MITETRKQINEIQDGLIRLMLFLEKHPEYEQFATVFVNAYGGGLCITLMDEKEKGIARQLAAASNWAWVRRAGRYDELYDWHCTTNDGVKVQFENAEPRPGQPAEVVTFEKGKT